MKSLSGKPIAEATLSRLKERIAGSSVIPGLAVILVGDDEASRLYVDLKAKAAQSIGLYFEQYALPASASQDEAASLISSLNVRPDIHGIIVQLPLPVGWEADKLIRLIDPHKDADGFHPETINRFLSGEKVEPPVFPRAVRTLLLSLDIPFGGKRAVVLANSALFGDVTQKALETLGLSVQILLPGEEEKRKDEIRASDVLVLARGKPHFLDGTLVRDHAIIIDGGITRVGDVVMSDADPESLVTKEGFITPVPGGVGPVTVATLLERVTELALGESEQRVY